MLRLYGILLGAALAGTALAAERQFDFSQDPAGETPKGFRSTVAGTGPAGVWKIVLDEVPSTLPAITPGAPGAGRRAVLAQVARDPTDEHFPLCLFEEETFGDFTLSTRFKIVDGDVEQMAGVVFRVQDERNFYVVRANAKDGNFRFYKVLNGERGPLIGPAVPVAKGVWHELSVECQGNQIRCRLDRQELIPDLKDNSFVSGKIGFWTKSDSVSYFTAARITYTPREPFVQGLVREIRQKYPRLLGLKILAPAPGPGGELKVIASHDPKDLGVVADKAEQDIFKRGVYYTARGKQSMSVYSPLHDRNGEIVGVTRIVMTTFFGQTEQNAIVRAMPIIKDMEAKLRAAKSLYE